MATAPETAIILAPLVPHGSPKFGVCLGRKLNAPLEEQRNDVATRKQIQREKPYLKRLREELNALLFGPEKHEPPVWYQWKGDQALRLQTRDAAHLDQLVERASNAALTNIRPSWIIPPEVRACDKHDENTSELGPSPIFRFYFSQPVIIGNIAFVEEAVVCGGLCGSGSLKALIERNGHWSILATRPTWIA